ncbi:biotin synthase BioB [Ectothiorhodospiraceae bacterium BW-2]|nr:biotin synthase BioB [Ectothiorhodospiraceae bacterium BW-2]
MGSATKPWRTEEALALLQQPFFDLLYQAQQIHRQHFNPHHIQLSTLLNIKTGGCAENCGYCSQSAHFDTAVEKEHLMAVDEVVSAAREAKAAGAGRFCMGAAWRQPTRRDMETLIAMVKGVKALGMESCATLGMLDDRQVAALKEAGLDYYNHNLDTSRDYYPQVVTTHSYQQRLDTIARVQQAGIHVCSGGIIGMGETRHDRAAMLTELANLDPPPQSVPLNRLVAVEGTPLAESESVDIFEFIRTIATARLMLPHAYIRLSAGRESMDESAQALAFMAGANSIFYGDKLLTAANATTHSDRRLLQRLDITPLSEPYESHPR